jgi:pSer/pThr/pTyr-binding forkhead associated (FHA) protein
MTGQALSAGGDPWANDSIAVRLAVSSPLGAREVTIYSGDAIQIGREDGPFTDLATDNISEPHALIAVGESCVHVTDLGRDRRGSTNGTFVDGRKIPPNEPVQVEHGSTISCAGDPPLTIQIAIER